MSAHTGQHAGTSSQEHHGAIAHGDSRMHNGNAYYYYASDMRIAGLAQESTQIKAPSTETATENGAKLWRAARLGQLPRVQRLLKLGADVSYRCNEHGTTALHQAVENSHKDVVTALLEADANVDDEDHEGKTALHGATSTDVVEALIMAGADVDHEDREGKTPGRLALDRRNTTVVDALINGCADPSKIYTPLEDVKCSRHMISGNQLDEEDADLQHDYIQGIPDPSAKYEQNTGDHSSTLAGKRSDFVLSLRTRNRNRSTSPTPGNRTIEYATSEPHETCSRTDQMLQPDLKGNVPATVAPEVPSPLPALDSSPTLVVGETDQEGKLVIGIEFASGSIVVSYAVGHAKSCIDRHIMCNDVDPTWAMAQSRHSGLYVRNLKELDGHTFITTGRDDARANYEVDLTLFFAALSGQILTKVDSMSCGNAARKFHKVIVVIVPTLWSSNLRRLILQATGSDDFRNAYAVTNSEAAAIYALSFNMRPIHNGDFYMVCHLEQQRCQRLFCAKHQVVSINPLRLEPIGKESYKYKPTIWAAGEGRFDRFRSKSKLAAEQDRKRIEGAELWSKMIRKTVSRKALSKDAAKGRIQAILLIGKAWTQELQAAIREDFPAIEIIYTNPDDDDTRADILREVVKHGLDV